MREGGILTNLSESEGWGRNTNNFEWEWGSEGEILTTLSENKGVREEWYLIQVKVCEEGNDGTNWMKPTSNKCDRGRGGGGYPLRMRMRERGNQRNKNSSC